MKPLKIVVLSAEGVTDLTPFVTDVTFTTGPNDWPFCDARQSTPGGRGHCTCFERKGHGGSHRCCTDHEWTDEERDR